MISFWIFLSPYLRAAKKREIKRSLPLMSCCLETMLQWTINHKANKGQCLWLGIFSKMFLPLEIKGKSN